MGAEWVMVIITAIYVIATIIMCVFNYESTQISKKQIEEMKKQYDDDKILKLMPCIQVKPIKNRNKVNHQTICDISFSQTPTFKAKFSFEISNIGHDIAKNISYSWKCNLGNSYGIIYSLPVGDKRTVCVTLIVEKITKVLNHSIVINYQDIQNNNYRQELFLVFEVNTNGIIIKSHVLSAPSIIPSQYKIYSPKRPSDYWQNRKRNKAMSNKDLNLKFGMSGFHRAFYDIFENPDYLTENKYAITYIKNNDDKQNITFKKLAETATMFAQNLDKYGVMHGDRAAIIAPTMPNTIISILALALWNVTAVVIDSKLPADEINRLISHSDVRSIFTVEEIYLKISAENVKQIPVFDLNLCDFKPVLFSLSDKTVKREKTPDKSYDVIAILFSSGTTGSMKGVMLTYDTILLAMDKQRYIFGLKPSEKYLLTLPLNHISGYSSLITFLFSGCQIGIVEDLSAARLSFALLEFNPHYFGMIPKVYDKIADTIISTVRKKNILVRSCVNALINFSGFCRKHFGIKIGKRLLKPIFSKAFGKDISGLAVMGAMCKPETSRLFLNFGLDWANLYGTTETLAPISSTGIFDRYVYDSVGKVSQFDDISIKINAPDSDGIGEIYVKTPMIMDGYFRDPDATVRAFDDGYFKTGDLGYIDDNNYLHITGREKDCIVLHNGEKVSAQDVDNFYQSVCPNITVASCAVSDSNGAEEIHIFLEADGKTAEEVSSAVESIKQKSLEKSSVYSLAGIHTINKIPVTSIGKVKRYLLNEQIGVQNPIPSVSTAPKNVTASTEEIVVNILKKHIKLASDIDLNSKLSDDLGFDSLAIFEIVNEISVATNVDVSDALVNIQTVEELINIVKNKNEYVRDFDISEFPHKKTDRDIKLLNRWIRLMRRLYNFDVIGVENILPNENFILCSNHINNLDPIWLLTAMGRTDGYKIGCLAAMHLIQNKFTKGMFNMLGSIPVNRSGNTTPALKRCKECLNDGYSLIIFPEGARTRDGEMLPFKNGAAQLSIETNKPIIPVRIDGGFEIFPRHKKLPCIFNFKKMRKYTIMVSFGIPIYPNGKNAQKITEELKITINELKRGEYN